MIGKKKTSPEQVALKDPNTGFLVYKPEDVKRVSLEYCVNLLSTKPPKAGYEQIFKDNEMMHNIRMKEIIENDIEELPIEIFHETIKRLKSKPGNKYDFLIKGGTGLKSALFNLFKTVWKEEKLPNGWTASTVIHLYKHQGSLNELSNFRHIHDKLDIFKMFNQIVTHVAKENIIENMSKYQIACVPNHRSSEHLFVIKSVMEYFQADGKGMILSGYDIKTYFESENIFDCMRELYESKVRGKVYRLIYEMNKQIKVKVKTPLEESDSKEAGSGPSQGNVDANCIETGVK